MDKCKTKETRKWDTEALKLLVAKYSFDVRYIRYCVTGERTSTTADVIKKEYEQIAKENAKNREEVLNTFLPTEKQNINQ